MRAARRQHLFGLRGVVRHPRLAEHVLARRERGRGELEMAVGPGADADGVDGGVVEQLLDALRDARDAVFRGHGLAARARAVDDVDDLDIIDLAKAGNVSQPLIAACPDQADSEGHVYS